MYPLMPGHSPVLHSSWGAYIFPDVTASDAGSCVGLILPESIEAASREQFEAVLKSLTNMLQQQTSEVLHEAATSQQPERISQKVSSVLSTAADWISWGLVKGAEKTGKLIQYGSEKLRENISPESQPSRIDPRAQQGVYYARCVTQGAVKVSSFLVHKLSDATAALGRTMAPHIRRYSQNLLPASITQRNPADGSSTLDDVVEVTASGLHGFATVYMGLERSAKILAKSLSEETVHIVQHKYGADAGKFTDHIVNTASGAAAASYNFSHLGIKAVAQRVAVDTTVAVASNCQGDGNESMETQDQTAQKH